MSRPLTLLFAAALAVTPVALGATAASADNRSGEWHGNNDWRWGHHHHYGAGFSVGAPGFAFSFGVPYEPRYSYYRPYARDCYRGYDGALYCRAY
jgi:hypothetical protein